MEFDQALKIITAIVTTVALFAAVAAILVNVYTFKQNQFSSIKALLLNNARAFKFEKPQNNADRILLRNNLYDYCGKKEACLDLAILCFNSPRPEVAIESFKEVGHIFTYSLEENKIKRLKGSSTSDKLKTWSLNSYFTFFLLSTAAFLFSIILSTPLGTPEIKTVNISNGIILFYLLAITIHATYEVSMNRRKTNSINHIQNML